MNYDCIKKVFFKFEPETAHKIAEVGLKISINLPFMSDYLVNKFCYIDTKLSQNIFGLNFLNPIGIAGGFDKNGTMIKPLSAFGFGFLEYGTITPKPQYGNPKPRLFRLVEEKSIQNFMGFNNHGLAEVKKRVKNIYPYCVPLIANIGKNKDTSNENSLKDYELLAKELNDCADIFVLNLSSPNTPNLRELQEVSFITELLEILKPVTNKPIILKLSPDMPVSKAISICQSAAELGISGIILNNTSIDYTLSKNAKDFGGISGQLITEKSREFFKEVARELFGKVVLISCGGIADANETYERIKMGASLVQIFTSFIYEGPEICKNINMQLVELLNKDGFSNISEAIGINIRK